MNFIRISLGISYHGLKTSKTKFLDYFISTLFRPKKYFYAFQILVRKLKKYFLHPFSNLHENMFFFYTKTELLCWEAWNRALISILCRSTDYFIILLQYPDTEFKEFEPRLKFKPRFKYGWFHLKLHSMFQDLSRRSIGGF